MKQILFILMLLVFLRSTGQTWSEWFRQKKTQKKYLLAQIAALKVYGGYVKKGYDISKKGLRSIGDIKHNDLHMHGDRFDALTVVSPKVKAYPKVNGYIIIQRSIIEHIGKAKTDVRVNQQLDIQEQIYMISVFDKLLTESFKDMEAFQDVVTDSKLSMTDDGRIKMVDKLYAGIQDKQVFLKSFWTGIKVLSLQRLNEKKDIIISKRVEGL